MSLDEEQKRNMKRVEQKGKGIMRKIKDEFLNAIIEKIKGKSIRKQLAFLLDPETIETSSRLKRNEVLAITQADFLGRKFNRFQCLRDFWVGTIEKREEDFVEATGGGFARWIISQEGKGRSEAINFVQASKEEKIIAPILSGITGSKKEKD